MPIHTHVQTPHNHTVAPHNHNGGNYFLVQYGGGGLNVVFPGDSFATSNQSGMNAQTYNDLPKQ
jgi:hypothetical protein